jgi:hypothetical protein
LALALGCGLLFAPSARAQRNADFGFDGWGGYLYLGHSEFGETYRDLDPGEYLGSQEELGLVANLRGHWLRLEARIGIGLAGVLPHEKNAQTNSFGGHQFRLHSTSFDEFNLRLPLPWPGQGAALQAGRLRLRTDPEAVFFGEYLLRYGAYPGYEERTAPPWDSLGSVAPRIDAVRLALGGPGSRLRSDWLLLVDSSDLKGNRDFSPALFLDATLPRGFSIGAGVELLRWFSTAYDGLKSPGEDIRSRTPLPNSGDTVPESQVDTITFSNTRSGTLVSLRAGLDVRALAGSDPGGWSDARVFAEVALLGWANQAVLYRDRLRRVAFTLGAHAPTHGLLDDLCLQAERQALHGKLSDGSASYSFFHPVPYRTEPDNWSLGAYAAKTVWVHLTVQAWILYQPVLRQGFFVYSIPGSGPSAESGWSREASFGLRLQARL